MNTDGHAAPFPVDVIIIDPSSLLKMLTWALTCGEEEAARGKIWEVIFSK